MNKHHNRMNRLTVILFFLFIVSFAILQPMIKDNKTSVIERRRLEQFPQFSFSKLMANEWVGSLETYLLDQFPMRESIKNLDTFVKQVMLRNGDINGFYKIDQFLSKILYPLNERDVIHNADKISEIYKLLLKDMNVYLTIVPDKGYFTAKPNGYPSINYETMMTLFKSHLVKDIQYIDIFPLLSIDDYYYTDAHWRQEKIYPVADKIADIMSIEILPMDAYTMKSFSPFKGVYFGRSANSFQTETLNYLTNDVINQTKVTFTGNSDNHMVYNTDDLKNLDAYDVFLGGPQPIITIDNSKASTKRELIVFRDSFGSSLTPLLLSAYSKITLIDLRYIDVSNLEEYIEFSNQDILFVYNTTVINNRFNFK